MLQYNTRCILLPELESQSIEGTMNTMLSIHRTVDVDSDHVLDVARLASYMT